MTDLYVAAPVSGQPAVNGNEMATAPAHPPWCDPGSCSVGVGGTGTHNSKPVELRATRPGSLGIVVTLAQGTPTPGYALSGVLLVDLTFTDTDDGYDFGTLPLDIDVAQRLGHVLVGAPQGIPDPDTHRTSSAAPALNALAPHTSGSATGRRPWPGNPHPGGRVPE